MRQRVITTALAAVISASSGLGLAIHAEDKESDKHSQKVQLGPRPFFLVKDMEAGPLKTRLSSCSNGPFETTAFSIGHRGAALQFPEHTREAYEAGARMGAGIVECDVMKVLDVLARDVGIRGIFSDWAATVTYYANCMGLK